MNKYKFLILFFIATINFYGESVYELKDISSEHWAFRSIENLYEKGILIFDEALFNGEETINRFELAYFLSKTLDNINQSKANRDDLLILEYIVYEFSSELSKFGFESKDYLDRLIFLEKELDQNKINNEKNRETLDNINDRLKELEKSNLARKNSFLNFASMYEDKMKYLDYFSLYLKSNVQYLPGSSAVSNENYRGLYTLGLAFQQENFELILESETNDNERKKGELNLKGQVESNVYQDYYFNFHTTGYERYITSYFNHVTYDNHNSFSYSIGEGSSERVYQNDSFDSYGISLRDSNLGFYIEKTNSDYDGVYLKSDGVTVNKDFVDTFNFIIEADFDNFKGLILRNGNNGNQDLELTVKYPLNNIEFIGGLSQSRGKGRTVIEIPDDAKELYKYDIINIINGEFIYKGKSDVGFGIEIKNEKVVLYNNYYGTFKYTLSKNGSIKYKYEHIDSFNDKYQNHYVIINMKGEKLKTYGSYNKIEADKQYLVNEKSTLKPYDKKSFYNETIIKVEYLFNEQIKANFGYLLREYTQEDKENENITLMQVEYKFRNNMKSYLKYIENSGTHFNDRKLDIDQNMIDLDFNSRTGVVREAKEGRIELGIEIEF